MRSQPGRPRWLVVDEYGHPRTIALTGRHADILVLLSRHPEGLSADHLAILLDEKDLDVVTVRAEVSRLRKIIGPEYIASRPYCWVQPIVSDVEGVRGTGARQRRVGSFALRGPAAERSSPRRSHGCEPR